MSNLVGKKVNGTLYYSLVSARRVEGKPQQKVLHYFGRYEQARQGIDRMRLDAEQKQAYLTKLARLEGLLETDTVPLPASSYSCLVIDPPWFYRLRKDDATHRNRIPYSPMPIEAILRLPIPVLSDRAGCVLWLWTTNNHMPEACRCLAHWGYELKTILTWMKVSKAGTVHLGTGHWLRNATEHCLVAVRGKLPSFMSQGVLTNQSTVLQARRREHSRKPEAFYALVEQCCLGSKLELFARQSRSGWDCWGNEVNKFAPSPDSQS